MSKLTQDTIRLPDLFHPSGSGGDQRRDALAKARYIGSSHHPVDERLALTGARFEPESCTYTSDHVVEPSAQFDEMAARCNDGTHAMRGGGFDMHLLV